MHVTIGYTSMHVYIFVFRLLINFVLLEVKVPNGHSHIQVLTSSFAGVVQC